MCNTVYIVYKVHRLFHRYRNKSVAELSMRVRVRSTFTQIFGFFLSFFFRPTFTNMCLPFDSIFYGACNTLLYMFPSLRFKVELIKYTIYRWQTVQWVLIHLQKFNNWFNLLTLINKWLHYSFQSRFVWSTFYFWKIKIFFFFFYLNFHKIIINELRIPL